MAQTWDVTLLESSAQTWDVTLWDGISGYTWYTLTITVIDETRIAMPTSLSSGQFSNSSLDSVQSHNSCFETRTAMPTSLSSGQFSNSSLDSVQSHNSRFESAVDYPVS